MNCEKCFAWDKRNLKCTIIKAHEIPGIRRTGVCPGYKTPEQDKKDRQRAKERLLSLGKKRHK